jgi:hypothetical protein
VIEMECLICHEAIKTKDVETMVAFDRKHAETCPIPPERGHA